MSDINKSYPLILVFYLDKELMMNKDIIAPFAEHVNRTIAEREANAMAFFLPTNGEERIECVSHTSEDYNLDFAMKLADDIKSNFFK